MSKTAILFLVQLLYGIGHFQTDVTINSVKIKSKPETSAKAGSSITLTCSVKFVARSGLPNQISYRFYKGSFKNLLLNTSMTSDQEYSFTIQSARASHTGYYLCDARVGNVTTTSEILHIKVTGQLQRPRLTIQPTTVIVGNEIELRCNAPEEIPPLDFTFYKDKNGQLSPAGHQGSNTNFVTYMVKVTETTNQIYSCKFKGRSLETYSNYSELVSIAVQDPFSSHLFTIEPQSQVFLGDNFTLRCRVQMSPLSASDTKYELTISKGSTLITQIVNGEAKISIKATAADEGLYSCIAKWERTLKTIEKLVTVTVPVSKPSLKSTALNGIVAQGGRLNLTCAVVNGSSPIIYTFYKGTPGKSFHLIILNATAAVHLIRTADIADSGEYFCEAENNAGIQKRRQRSQNIAINVKGTVLNGWGYYLLAILLLFFFLLLSLCCFFNVKNKKKKRRKIMKQQNQGSVKENTVVIFSKVIEMAHPRLSDKDSYALMEDEEKDYINITSSKGTGTDSECDCEMNYVNIVREKAATNMDDSSANEDEITYTELNLASPKNKNVLQQEGTLYAQINLHRQ